MPNAIEFDQVKKKGKTKEKRRYLFVDGSNLYAGQYELFGPDGYLLFNRFIQNIETKLTLKFIKIFFYTSYSPKPAKPTVKQKNYLRNEALFYRCVKNTNHVLFFTGYRSKTSGKEKEVDVKLAVDIVDLSHRDRMDEVYLMSGDADFMHALFAANNTGKKVKLLCINNKILYKGAFYFPLTILSLDGKFDQPRLRTKKILIIKLSTGELVGRVKKAP